jgi:hypothetical protein
MSQMYYFEPLNDAISGYRVSITIGEAVLSWHESRQNEIGLYKAYVTPYPTNYDRFTNKVTGSEWQKREAGEYTSPESQFISNEYPVYEQVWNVEPLSQQEQALLTEQAEIVVATEIESRLTSVNAWASARHIANTATPISSGVKTYINNLFALNGSPNYPFALADEVENGSYTNWPSKLSTRELYQLVDPT